MRCKTILVALLLLAFGAEAARVSQSEAAGAASVWAGAGKALGARLGTNVESVREHAVTNGYSFYSVKLDGGTVIMTSDTDLEPVIAFSPSGDIDLSEGSPLLDLLRRDVAARAALSGAFASEAAAPTRRRLMATGATGSAASSSSSPTTVRRPGAPLWDTLLSANQQAATSSTKPSKRLLATSANPVASVSDVRVAPMTKSKWSQFTAGGMNCYNYYTPYNYVCGCTATAMSQIMRYFEFPNTEVQPREYNCKVGSGTEKLTTQGGIYDWANMTLDPELAAMAGELSEENCEAIGKLTSDAGIAVQSSYTAKSTGADPELVAAALRDVFVYPDAVSYFNEGALTNGVVGLHKADLRRRVILANLDARQPVLLAIYGYASAFIGNRDYWSGHAVVADGYGYQTVAGVETEFVHINMGWAGLDDMWYNIPEINAANSGAHIGDVGYDYLYLGGATFNISTANDTDAGRAILSGRVADDEGVAVPGARIVAYDATNANVAETVSDEYGVYFFKLPGDAAYMVEAISADGRSKADVVVDNLPATKGLNSSYCVYVDSNVGNSWGNDMVLAPPSVRVGDEIFSSIDSALAKARALAETQGSPVVVEVLDATKFKRAATIDFDCVLVATNAAPAESPVECRSGAQFVVAPGATLTISNVVFSSAGSTLVDVADGGVLAIAGAVDFGVPYSAPAVKTVAATNLLLTCGLEHGFTLACTEATNTVDTFGYAYATDGDVYAAITGSVSRIANYYDETGEVRGYMTGSSPYYPLVWLQQAVPVEDCIGYFVDSSGKTNTAGRIDRLFDRYSEAQAGGRLGDERRIVIRESGSLSCSLTVSNDTSIVGEGIEINFGGASSAGFTVNTGKLSVSGISFTNYVGNALFLVDGDDASLALGPDVAFSDIEGTNRLSGAVTVCKGSASATGATFENCRATGKFDPQGNPRTSCGGAFYLNDGTGLALEDVSISGCSANSLGGAVYARKGATVSLAGNMYVSGNRAGAFDDDIHIRNVVSEPAKLVLAAAVSGKVGVRLMGGEQNGNGYGSEAGQLFADATDADVANASAAAFFCDNTDLVAEPVGAALRWVEPPNGPQPWEGDPDEASARVEYANGTTNYYRLVSEALEAVSGDATIYVQGLNEIALTSDVVISNNITLASDRKIAKDLDLDSFWLYRADNCSIRVVEGASLTLRDIKVFGVPVNDRGEPLYGYSFAFDISKPLFKVSGAGGSLTLASPSEGCCTEIAHAIAGGIDAAGNIVGARDAGAVSVWGGGHFRMESGSCIRDCRNWYVNDADGSGRGGAVLVDDGEAVFAGGTVTNCVAYTAGGVFVGNNGTVSVSGDTRIIDNYDLFGDDSNLVVHDLGNLTLAGKMTGAIGYTEGVAGDKVVFGKVADGVSPADAQSSAHNFTHDVTGDVGMAVSGSDGMLLVWSESVDTDGVYVDDDGNEHSLVARDEDPVRVAVPKAVEDLLSYNGEEQIGVEPGMGYAIAGNVATNAGAYVATATLKAGFAWDDGSTGATNVNWSIAKATYDMSGVSFDDKTVVYSGQDHVLEISGKLPEGVSVSYENNGHSVAGVYVVVASFSGDEENYEPIEPKEATLTIVAVAPPTPPSSGPVAQPLPVAFTAISEADGTWTLSVTTAVEKCWYSLYATNSLSGGFGIEDVEPVELRKAGADDVPTMIFTWPSDGSQLFWKVLAEPENAH